jgi:hypothetical protein
MMKNLFLSLLFTLSVSGQEVFPPTLKDVTIKHNFVTLTWWHPDAYEFEIRTAVPNMERPTFIKLDKTKLFHDERARGITTFSEKVLIIANEMSVSVRAVFGTNVTEFSNPIVVIMGPSTNPGTSRNNTTIPIPPAIVPPLTP